MKKKRTLKSHTRLTLSGKLFQKQLLSLIGQYKKQTKRHIHVKIKTKGAFLSYPSKLTVNLSMVDEKTTKMIIKGETPVTTITSVADYGRTGERIEVLVATLSKLMAAKP